MTRDPERLLTTASGLDRAVLASAGRDAPSRRARERAAVAAGLAVGAGAVVATTSTGAAAGAAGAAGALGKATFLATALKVGASIVVLGAASYVAARAVAPAEGPQVAAMSAPSAAIAPPAGGASARTASRWAIPDPEPAAPATATTETATPEAASPASDTAAVPATTPRVPSAPPSAGEAQLPGIGAEIAALEAARRKLAAGDAAGALEDARRYARVHPGGAMAPEAQVVRVDALSALGRTAAAQAEAASYVARYPDSPAAPRLRRLIEKSDQGEGSSP